MKLRDPRVGEIVHIRERPAAFSFFPTYKAKGGEGLHSTLFASDPWNLIQNSLERIKDTTAKRQALAFWLQARDFYTAAQNSDISAAKPLLLYYSFLNLAKCFVVKKGRSALGRVRHGLSEKLPVSATAVHGSVSIDITGSPTTSAFLMFANALGAILPRPVPPATTIEVRSTDFLSQVLIGHRIFCQAESIKERFVSIDRIDYMQEQASKEVWLRVRAFADDFTRLGYPMTNLSRCLSDQHGWYNVKCDIAIDGRRVIEAQMSTGVPYGSRPSQVVARISKAACSRMWRSVTAYPPYRKYYVYIPAPTQVLLNQLLAIYLGTFYFGSITRYKPEQFDGMLRSPLGPFISEFFSNQPSQFLFLIASEFMEQEVTRAAIA